MITNGSPDSGRTSTAELAVIDSRPEPVSSEALAPFGQLIQPAGYGQAHSPEDARLDLSAGQPRLYIMRSSYHDMAFTRITRHQRVTQCLGSRDDRDWFIAMAAPDAGTDAPATDAIHAFHVPGETAIKLERGTWHAGPFFTWDWLDFYNLELTDTNQTDSDTVNHGERHGLSFSVATPDNTA